ncbi:autotransporter outer membrane beta-barrel domain-containing protein [Mucilaginibacter sp. E4BP6]|uniref:autotransporter outer membrane beta-barrel domain-containing protein n=1 Tax=Mucilaginibacter sp. E4BP6 TaxID=2723089 RepID=UPI0015CA24CD|nr:autotransporter outer membrane beta-barrel domain-containing protein [Mucilaginibacter sp. E4BP6]NYE66898.1 hypothetical protein [Mucilaginibacter sp. E4BP6]
MKNKLLLLAGFVFIYIPFAKAQIVDQDASGKSSIVTPGTSINLNITQTQIQGTHYGSFGSKAQGIYGLDLTANNATGVGSLFDNGKFSPGGAIAGLLGYRFTVFEYADKSRLQYQLAIQNLVAAQNKLGPAYRNEVAKDAAASGLPQMEQNTVTTELQDLDENGLENLQESLQEYKSSVTDTAALPKIKAVVAQLQIFVAGQNKDIAEIKAEAVSLLNMHTPPLIKNSTVITYLRGGYSANEFTYDQGDSFSDYTKRFQDTTGKTWFIEIGSTYQFKANFLGLDFGYSHQDNMSALTSADYSYSYQDTTITSGKLTKTKAFTAYSGKYGYYGKVYLNVDYQHLFTIDTSKYVGIGPYLRWNHDLNAAGLATDATVLGMSFNYLNGKSGTFLGGIYLQSDDVSGHTQPIFSKSIQFGIVAKFNLGSIFILK